MEHHRTSEHPYRQDGDTDADFKLNPEATDEELFLPFGAPDFECRPVPNPCGVGPRLDNLPDDPVRRCGIGDGERRWNLRPAKTLKTCSIQSTHPTNHVFQTLRKKSGLHTIMHEKLKILDAQRLGDSFDKSPSRICCSNGARSKANVWKEQERNG